MLKLILLSFIFIFSTSINAFAEPNIIDKPIVWSEYREQLIMEYTQLHYGKAQNRIIPQAVVIHWTASDTLQSAYNWFYNESVYEDGTLTLNVASHFMVDRDGTIYRLTDETALNRHIIGYNWCAIGIENVGGVNGVEDLTSAQLESNVELIKYLQKKYPSIEYVFGHYQQDAARESGLYIELVPNYYAIKTDPGVNFMNELKQRLSFDGLKFFE